VNTRDWSCCKTREVFHMISNFLGGSHQERGLDRHCLAVVAKAGIARAWCSVQRNIVSFFVSVTRNGMFLRVCENGIEQRRLDMRSIVSWLSLTRDTRYWCSRRGRTTVVNTAVAHNMSACIP
jgi:hypothetical protein